MKNICRITAIIQIIFLITVSCTKKQDYELVSPDGNLQMKFFQTADGCILYSFTVGGQTLISASPLGFQTESGASILSGNWRIESAAYREVNRVWNPVWGKRKTVPNHFKELSLSLTTNAPSPLTNIKITARAYNDGIAFRYIIPPGQTDPVNITEELTGFHFAGDYTAWFYNGENHNIGPEKLSNCEGRYRPVMTVKTDNHYLAVHEAELIDGVPLALSTKMGETLFSVAPEPETLYPGYTSAWRVVLSGSTPGQLIDSHLIELLNPPPHEGSDFSWVKPGVAVWDWRINGAVTDDGFRYTMSYPSWVRMIDFAAEQGFSYLVLDADWYGPEHEAESNPLAGNKTEDVKRIIRYGKEKGIGVWLYLNDVGGRKYPIEETLKQYGTWGAAGIKYGFMTGTPREKNKWTQKITELCAQNKLLVDFHDNPIHPYGQMRTWPNVVTREFCHAQLDGHHVFQPVTFVTSVFVNMIAGPL
ncbi:MAG: glycoside hydrolase family 97 N-terminal domain-containing protein, partial [Tannerella sp.]|nr:glycoside hydrolase family 97 N-terminal domain-containing protein [Tannerella sp.]